MNNNMQRVFCFILTLTLVVGLLPSFAPVVAATETTEPAAQSGVYRWEISGDGTGLVSAAGYEENALTVHGEGTVTDGVCSGAVYTLTTPVTLSAGAQWVVEWKSAGGDQAALLSGDAVIGEGVRYLCQKPEGFWAVGYLSGETYNNYGLADQSIDVSQSHVYRLENRVAEDGTNMVWLVVDGAEIGALNKYHADSMADETADGNWLNGQELTFGAIGAEQFPLNGVTLEYLQIWTDTEPVHEHSYQITSTVEGNCIAMGEHVYTCSCGDSYTESSGEYGSHVFTKWTVMGEVKQSNCEICNMTETVKIGADYDESVSKNYYMVVSQKNFALCDGVIETELVLDNETGTRRQLLTIVEVDTANTNVEILPGYYGIDKDLTKSENWKSCSVDEVMEYYHDELGYNVVAGMNTALTYTSYAPCSFLVFNGQVLATPGGIYNDNCDTYLAVTRNPDGTVSCELRPISEALHGDELHAVACNFGYTVKNGKVVTKKVARGEGSDRSMVGIKKDGSLVIVQAEGANAGRSNGLTKYEMGETMLALGCMWAVNGDGGGSSQIFTKRESDGGYVLRNKPSDGALRSTLNSIIIASKAAEAGVFACVALSAENAVIIPGGSTGVSVQAYDGTNAPIGMPEGVTFEVTGGTFADGVFVSDGTQGVQTVTAVYNGKAVGSVEIRTAMPDRLEFSNTSIVVPYGETVKLEVSAYCGDDRVKLTDSDVVFTLSEAVGTVAGNLFTAVDEAAAGGSNAAELTATLAADDQVSVTIPLLVGKGSEVLQNFEDGSVHGWYRSARAEYNAVQAGGSAYIVDKSSGQVHSGSYAMAAKVDFSNSLETKCHWQTLVAGETVVLHHASRLGMWIYIPEEAVGIELQAQLATFKDADGTVDNAQGIAGNFCIAGAGDTATTAVGFNKAFDESGWHYISIDLTGAEYVGFLKDSSNIGFLISQEDGANGYKYSQQKSVNGEFVFYIDDITVDYSEAADDREAPEFGAMTYAVSGGAHKELNGNTVSSYNISFAAPVAEYTGNPNYTGLDKASARAYIDGTDYTGKLTWSGNKMTLSGVVLSTGMHTVKFSICDKAGNYDSVIRTIIVGSAAGAKVKVVPHDSAADKLLLGSLYYIDVVADDPETVASVKTTLDLNSISVWQLEHMEVADGFKASYTVNQDENSVTLTVVSDGETQLRGNDQILVSIPVRTWELEPVEPIFGRTDVWMYDDYKAAGSVLPMDLQVEITAGSVSYRNGASGTFTSPTIRVDTEMTGNVTSGWNGGHDHRAETAQYYAEGSSNHVDATALEDKIANCLEGGYTGRTYCEVCQSVVDWGTVTGAAGHNYVVTEGVLQCEHCGILFNGIFTDGKEYVDGVTMGDGWAGESYYRNGSMVKGVQKVPSPEDPATEYYYNFGETGVCKKQVKFTGLFRDGDVYRYSHVGVLSSGWQNIDGNWYYFDPATMANVSGRYKIKGVAFTFEEDGKLTEGVWVDTLEGRRYYYGPSYQMWHWLEVDGKLYYFKDGYMLTGRQNVRNLEVPQVRSWYDFGDDGVCRGILDGIVEANGNYYYTENGVGLEKYLVYYDGNYYFAEYDGKLVTNQRKYAYVTNCDLPCEWYYFGPDGKMIGGKDGGSIVEINGELRYYEKGRPAEKGLVCVDGDYYFTMYDGELVINKNYYAWMTNCDLPMDRYDFGPDGKMIGSKAEGEIVEVNGEKLYYEKGKAAEKGLVCVDGDYYFSVYGGKLITDQVYYAWMTSCDLPKDRYEFGPDGKMLQGIVVKDGVPRYYENGKGAEKGLIEYEGDYYFTVYNGELIKDQIYYAWMTNCDLPKERYEFGPDGKMLQGIVERDGILYYYENGRGTEKGLIEYEGNYYFTMYKGELVTGKRYYAYATSCDLPNGWYEFASDGKMIRGIVELDGALYYYENGKKAAVGLVCIDGSYYHAGEDGKLAVNETVNVTVSSCDLPVGVYTFDASGKALDGFVSRDGEVYYYDKGRTKAGLFLLDGAYYFTEEDGKLVRGKTYYAYATNCDLPTGNYEFGADGRMVQGIVERDGAYYYYENGRRVEKNLFYLDGHYYFAHTGGKLVTSQTFYVYEANGLLIEQEYTFNELGQIVG